jgi:hypothetical protein
MAGVIDTRAPGVSPELSSAQDTATPGARLIRYNLGVTFICRHACAYLDTGTTTEGSQAMEGQRRSSRSGIRFALWDGSRDLDCQFMTCQKALGATGLIVRSFREGAAPTGKPFEARRGIGRLPVCEGGWAQLAEAVRDPARDFDAVVCDRIERISRRVDVFCLRRAVCAEQGVPIVCADTLPEFLADPTSAAFHLIQVAMADREDAIRAVGRRRVHRDLRH